MNLARYIAKNRARMQIHTGGAFVLIALIILFALAGTPGWSISKHRGEVDRAVEASLQRLESTRAQIAKLKRDVEQTESQLRPVSATLDQRVLDLSTLASQFNLQVDSVERANGAGLTAQASISVTARGSYPSIVMFLQSLREQSPDLTVTTLRIGTSSGRSCTCQLSLTWWAPPAQSMVADSNGSLP